MGSGRGEERENLQLILLTRHVSSAVDGAEGQLVDVDAAEGADLDWTC